MSDQLPTNDILNLAVNVSDSAASSTAGRSTSDETIAEGSEVFAAQLSSVQQSAKDALNSQHGEIEPEQVAQGEPGSVLDAEDLHRRTVDDGQDVSIDSNSSDSSASGLIGASAEPSWVSETGVLANHGRPAIAEIPAGTGQPEEIEGVEPGSVNAKANEHSALDSVRRGLDMPTGIEKPPTTGDSDYTSALAVQSGQLPAGTANELTGKKALSLDISGHAPDSDSLVNANGLLSAQLKQSGTPLTASATGEALNKPALTSIQLAAALSSAQRTTGDKFVAGSTTMQHKPDAVEGGNAADLVGVDLLSVDAELLTTAIDKTASPGVLQNAVQADRQVTSGVTSQVTPTTDALQTLASGLTELSNTSASPVTSDSKPAPLQPAVADQNNSALTGMTAEPDSPEAESKAVAAEAGQAEFASASAEIGSRGARDGFSEPANMFHATASGIVAAPVSHRSEPGVALPVAPQQVSLSSGNADEALLENVQWMIGENVRSATVNVTPAGMGQISIKVDMESEQVSVSIVAGQGATREALDAALPRLREQLSLQGLESVRVDISDGRSEHSRANDESRRFMERPNHNVTGEESEREAHAGSGEQRPVFGRSRGLVDAYA